MPWRGFVARDGVGVLRLRARPRSGLALAQDDKPGDGNDGGLRRLLFLILQQFDGALELLIFLGRLGLLELLGSGGVVLLVVGQVGIIRYVGDRDAGGDRGV